MSARLRCPVWVVLLAAAAGGGCMRQSYAPAAPPTTPLPRELSKINHPEYMIEPPDILQIDVLYAVPLPPYKIASLDVLGIKVPNAIPTAPINGPFVVDPDGTIDLGEAYTRHKVSVVGLTLPEAKAAVETALKADLKEEAAKADVVLLESRGAQQVRGPHLVRPDGTVSLGKYGAVNVTGLTLAQARQKLEAHLSQFLQNPEVTVDVLAYNSKVYYVIFDYGGSGQQVVRLPVTGNETVLDAISQLYGLTSVSDAHRIWVARAGDNGCEQILPVDWNAITAMGKANTNYQLLPGDRVFVMAYPLVAVDNRLARLFAPIERTLGITLLGTSTVRAIGNSNGTTVP